MSLPLPNLPEGCVVITCQANIADMEPTQRILAPRMVSKLQRFVEDSYLPQEVDGEVVKVPQFPNGMTQVLEEILDVNLLKMLEERYPDPFDSTIADLEAQLAAAKAAAQVKFIQPQE